MSHGRLRGLYLVTPELPTTELVRRLEMALEGGKGRVALVQYRNKHLPRAQAREQIRAMAPLCRAAGVPVLINDDVELALETGAAGVHVGADDPSLETARRRLGPEAIVGVSCYDRLDLARAAAAGGADYVAFGSFFPSPTKPGAVRASIDLLRRARRELDLPIAAIGGITAARAGELVTAGADLLAVISDVFAAPDPRRAATACARHFGRPTAPERASPLL